MTFAVSVNRPLVADSGDAPNRGDRGSRDASVAESERHVVVQFRFLVADAVTFDDEPRAV